MNWQLIIGYIGLFSSALCITYAFVRLTTGKNLTFVQFLGFILSFLSMLP